MLYKVIINISIPPQPKNTMLPIPPNTFVGHEVLASWSMMKFNVSVSGAIESILVQNLTMRGKEICNTLNNRMKIWRSNCN